MDAKNWAKVKEAFAGSVDLDESERRSKLDEICGGDDALRAEVEALLRANDEVEGFIEEPAFSVTDALPSAPVSVEGKMIGHYRIVREIGRGGMGTVFLATRDDGEFQQEVAIKIVSNSLLGPESLRRFRQERQILARLNHPNIARLLDGGATDDGMPYLVMEYVEGEALREYADKHDLSVDDKLRIFLKICRAFAYAHGNLVVHRDIKPSNILITSEGEPKLLDFGLAKILEIGVDEVRTAPNFRALTPAYASPEQLRDEAITTASDIYSLGVVLYELLTGSRPFEQDSVSFEKMLQLISASEPPRPSALVSDGTGDNNADSKRSARRQQSFKGDVDNIVMMALRKEPERRYGSADQLAEDIERHLKGLPVVATDPTFGYRASKFISRHWIGLTSIGVIMLVLIAGIATTAWQARVAKRERDHAQRERDKAEQLNAFLQSILAAASPAEKGKNAKVIEVLDDAVARMETELADLPELKAKALTTIGRTYDELGLPETAEPKLRAALAIYTELFPNDNKDKTQCMEHLANSLVGQYKFDEAESLLNAVIEIERREPAGKELSRALFILGELKVRQAKYVDAETILNESISICDAVPDGSRFDCAYYRISLGRAEQFAGDLNGSESIFRQCLDVFRSQPDRYAIRIADLSVNLGDVLLAKTELDAAITTLKDADQIYHRQLGDASLYLVISKFYLSRAYLAKNENEKASQFAHESIEIARKINWIENRNYIGALKIMGLSLTRLGDPDQGETYLREAVAGANKNLAPNDPRTPDIESALGECLTEKGQFAHAEGVLLSAFAKQDADPAGIETKRRLARLYKKWKRADEAKKYE